MAALQVFEEMQSNAILPDEVSVLAEPKMLKLQSKMAMKIFKVTSFCGGTGGCTNPTKCCMTRVPEMSSCSAEALRCVHEHVSECHYGSRP